MAYLTPISQERNRNLKIASMAPHVLSCTTPRCPESPTPLRGLSCEGGCYAFYSLLTLYYVVICNSLFTHPASHQMAIVPAAKPRLASKSFRWDPMGSKNTSPEPSAVRPHVSNVPNNVWTTAVCPSIMFV